MKRSKFIKTVAGAALAGPALISFMKQSVESGIALGLDAYCIRNSGWNVFQLLDYGARLKLDVIQVSNDNLESIADDYLKKSKEYARKAGVTLQYSNGCINPLSKRWENIADPTTYLLEGLRITKGLGATMLNCIAGDGVDRHSDVSTPAQMEATIKALRTVRTEFIGAGIKISVENHGDLLARETKTIIEEAGKDFVGSNLDAGNCTMSGEDPLLALEVLGSLVICTHIRDSVITENPRGASVKWVALGDGTIDFKQFAARFKELCPTAPFLLEIFTGGDPRVLPCFEDDYWKAYPNMPAADFARFIKLAKAGLPTTNSTTTDPTPLSAMDKGAQQRAAFEQSIEYARKTLGLGIRWQV